MAEDAPAIHEKGLWTLAAMLTKDQIPDDRHCFHFHHAVNVKPQMTPEDSAAVSVAVDVFCHGCPWASNAPLQIPVQRPQMIGFPFLLDWLAAVAGHALPAGRILEVAPAPLLHQLPIAFLIVRHAAVVAGARNNDSGHIVAHYLPWPRSVL